MAYRLNVFFASVGGSALFFSAYWYMARPLVPPNASSIRTDDQDLRASFREPPRRVGHSEAGTAGPES